MEDLVADIVEGGRRLQFEGQILSFHTRERFLQGTRAGLEFVLCHEYLCDPGVPKNLFSDLDG